MKKVLWSRVSRTIIALLFAVSASLVSVGRPLMAEPLNGGAWEKISTQEMEDAFHDIGGIYAFAEYNGKLYAGGSADIEENGEYPAVMYAKDTDGNFELMSHDFGQGLDSHVTHMTVFDNKLYVAVQAWNPEPLKIWIYDSTTDTWAEDSKFKLNDGRVDDYITTTLGMGVAGDKLCATVTDLAVADLNMTVMCTDGTADWTPLPNTGITSTEFTRAFVSNLIIVPDSTGVGIVANDDIGDGNVSSSLWLYDDINDPDGEWIQLPVHDIGDNRIITAAFGFAEEASWGFYVVAEDYPSFGNAEVWLEPFGEWQNLAESGYGDPGVNDVKYILPYQPGDEESRKLLLPGTVTDGEGGYMAALKAFGYFDNSESPEWRDIGPTIEQIGDDSDNPSQTVLSAYISENNDIYLGLKGVSGSGDSTVWKFTLLPAEDDGVPNNGDANNDGTPDSEQDNVTSLHNSVTGKYSVLEVSDECIINRVEIVPESGVNTNGDAGYDYPAGLMDFSIDCGVDGFTAEIKQYHYGLSDDDLILRKFNPGSGYFTIDSATTTDQTIAAQNVKVVTYQITDGSVLDIDDEVNGTIEDPAGLAVQAVGVPNTGLGGRSKLL